MENALDILKNYTIPSDNRELQLRTHHFDMDFDYTIPSDNRELQQQMEFMTL